MYEVKLISKKLEILNMLIAVYSFLKVKNQNLLRYIYLTN